MESRPSELTEEQYDNGIDIQGLSWGVDEVPEKEDFREKRYSHLPSSLTISVKDYGSLIVKPPPQPASMNPVCRPRQRKLTPGT